MKNKLILWAASVVLLCGGCLEMTTPDDVIEVDAKMDELNSSLDSYQDLIRGVVGQLEKDKLVSEGTASKVEAIHEKIDTMQPIVEEAVHNVVSAEYSGDKLLDAIRAAEAVNLASGPVNPYAPAVDLVLKGLLGVFGASGAAVAVKTSRDRKKVLAGVARLEREAEPALAAKIHEAINGV